MELDENAGKKCGAAIIAALDLVSRHCNGIKPSIVLLDRDNALIHYGNPSLLEEIGDMKPDISLEEKIRIIADTKWARHLAEGWCTKVAGFTPGTEEYEKCFENARYYIAKRAAMSG